MWAPPSSHEAVLSPSHAALLLLPARSPHHCLLLLSLQARELEELAQIYVQRGLPYELARQVAVVLTEKDVIRAHARDELGIGEAAAAPVMLCCRWRRRHRLM